MSQAPHHGRYHWPRRLVAATPVLPILIVSAIVLVDLVCGSGMTWLPLLAVGPALAATTNGPRGVLWVGLLAAALGAILGIRDDAGARELAVVLAALMAVTLAGSLASALRGRRERVLAAVRSVAEAAQHALLQPVPATVGPFQVAVRYSAAAAEARIGGDLYALVSTPYGVRMIVGDVRGKGLPAVGTAALVLGVFREAAYDEPDLLAVVARIERSLARNLGSDDFVTAVVAGYPREGQLEVVNCGHAPPLLVRDSVVVPVDPDRPAPPSGCAPSRVRRRRCRSCPSPTGTSCCSTPTASPRPATTSGSSTRSPTGWHGTRATSRHTPSPPSTTSCSTMSAAGSTTTRHCCCSACRPRPSPPPTMTCPTPDASVPARRSPQGAGICATDHNGAAPERRHNPAPRPGPPRDRTRARPVHRC